ncbi:MAG: hypothetical protein ACI9VR_002885 [Cognaticolwellia sp.]|jgi:hypothetical protein
MKSKSKRGDLSAELARPAKKTEGPGELQDVEHGNAARQEELLSVQTESGPQGFSGPPPSPDTPVDPNEDLIDWVSALLGEELGDVRILMGAAENQAIQSGGQDTVHLQGTRPRFGSLVHELTHVVQRRRGGVQGEDRAVDQGGAAEREASKAAQALAGGGTFSAQARTDARVHREDGETLDPAAQIFEALHGSLFSEDEGAALEALRAGGSVTREVYLGRYLRKLETEFYNFCNDTQYAQALSILLPAMPLADQIELSMGSFNDDEAGILLSIVGSTPAKRAVYAANTGLVEQHLSELSDVDAFAARQVLYPEAVVDNLGRFIQDANGWIWDTEGPVYSALLNATPEQRLLVWNTHQAGLSALLNAEELLKVQSMCMGSDGGVAGETQALESRMALATDHLGTDDEGVQDAVGRLSELQREYAQLMRAMELHNARDGGTLSGEQVRAAQTRLLELEGLTSLLGQGEQGALEPDSFMGMAQGDVAQETYSSLQQQVGMDSYTQAKQDLLGAWGAWSSDEAAMLRALEAVPPEHLEALRRDWDLRLVFAELRLDEPEHLALIDGQDADGLALLKLRGLLDAMLSDTGAILLALVAMSPEARARIPYDAQLQLDLYKAGGGAWGDAVRETLRSGTLPTDYALDAAMGGDWDSTDEGLLNATLANLPQGERDELQLGYMLVAKGQAGSTPEERAAISKWQALRSRMEGELELDELDDAMQAFAGGVTPEELTDPAACERRMWVMRARLDERLEMDGYLTEAVSTTDDTVVLAHARFMVRFEQAVAGREFNAVALAELAVLEQDFNQAFGSFADTSSMLGQVAAAVAAIVVAVVLAPPSGGASLGLYAAAVSVGGASAAVANEAFGGDFTGTDEAARAAVMGAVEAGTGLAAAQLAVGLTAGVGLSGQALKAVIIRAATEGAEVGVGVWGRAVGRASLQGAIEGAIGGMAGGLAMSATELKTWQQTFWAAVVTMTREMVQTGLIGFGAGAALGGALERAQMAMASRALRGVALRQVDDLADGARILSSGDGFSLHFGPDISDADLVAHLDTLQSMQRTSAMSASLRRILGEELADDLVPPPGSAGYEARQELRKIQQMLDERQAMLEGELLPPSTRQEIADEMERFEAHIEHYRQRVNLLDDGAGVVAVPEGLPADYPDPPDGYYYQGTRNGGWMVVRRDTSSSDALRLVRADDGSWSFVPVAAQPSPSFPPGTTRAQAYEQLTAEHSRSSFKQWAEMVESQGIATRDELIAAMPDISASAGIAEDTLRHHVKAHFRDAILDRMAGSIEEPLDLATAHRRLLEMTDGLNSSDKGNLTESWYTRIRERTDGVELEAHPRLAAEITPSGRARSPDFLETIDGDTALVEIKSTKSGLSNDDVVQIEDSLKLIEQERCAVTGLDEPVEEMRLVFTDVRGARGSRDQLEDWFANYDGFEVEVFVGGEFKTAANLTELKALL